MCEVSVILEKLKSFGGTEAGTTRLSYSPEFLQARDFLAAYMQACGMNTEIDLMGNLIGSYLGTKPELPVVLTGSHLDTVPNGGNYDGALGIAMPLACIKKWATEKFRPERTVKVIAMVEEEGTLFNIGCMSSRTLIGEFQNLSEANIMDSEGRSFESYLQGAGLAGRVFKEAVWDMSVVKCFIETHIEQGEELISQGLSVGLVETIVGIDRREIVLQGQANHAGTTKMQGRRDALLGAAEVISKVNLLAKASAGEFVATVGKLDIFPNAVNVIAGQVKVHIETRAASQIILEQAYQEIIKILDAVSASCDLTYKIVAEHKIAPIELSPEITAVFQDVCEKQKISFRRLPSWAGHDAKVLAEKVPTGLLFLPSVAGISHSPLEFTREIDIAKGLTVLEQTLKNLSKI